MAVSSSAMKLLLKITVSAGIIVWLVATLEWHALVAALKDSLPIYLLAAFLAIQLTVFSSVWKWRLLIHAIWQDKQPAKETSFFQLCKLYYIGLFFNNFLPSSVGGDVVRVVRLSKTTGPTVAATSVALERFTSGAAMIAILLCSAAFVDSIRPFLVSILLITVIFLAIFIAAVWLVKKSERQPLRAESTPTPNGLLRMAQKVQSGLADFGNTLREYRQKTLGWWLWIGLLSIAFQVGMVWINYYLLEAFQIEVPIGQLFVIITLISALTMLPISINGIGVREVSYVFFFGQLGVSAEIAVSVSLLFFVFVTCSSLAGGVWWVLDRGQKAHDLHESFEKHRKVEPSLRQKQEF